MRRNDDVVQRSERMIKRQRLDIKNIEPCTANSAFAERGDQSALVDDGSP